MRSGWVGRALGRLGVGTLGSRDREELIEAFVRILDQEGHVEWGRDIEFVDAFFATRVLLGRNPTRQELKRFRARQQAGGVTGRDFLARVLESEEFRSVTQFVPPGHELMSDTNGFRFHFRTHDREMGVRMGLGLYEPDIVQIVRSLAPRCRNMIDCGANTGFFTCTFLAVAEPAAKVVAFEPMAESQELFRKNMTANGFDDRVTLHGVACGSERGEIRMSQVSNMMIGTDVGDAPSMVVPIVSLDETVEGPVDLIKLDIEGAEPQALRGMRRILAEHRPIVITELNEYWLNSVSGVGSREFVRELESHGYKVVLAGAYARGRSTGVSFPEDDPLFTTEVVAVPLGSGSGSG